MENRFIFNDGGICINPIVPFDYKDKGNNWVNLSIAQFNNGRWDFRLITVFDKGGEGKPYGESRYSSEQEAIKESLNYLSTKLPEIKQFCKDSEFTVFLKAYNNFKMDKGQLDLF